MLIFTLFLTSCGEKKEILTEDIKTNSNTGVVVNNIQEVKKEEISTGSLQENTGAIETETKDVIGKSFIPKKNIYYIGNYESEDVAYVLDLNGNESVYYFNNKESKNFDEKNIHKKIKGLQEIYKLNYIDSSNGNKVYESMMNILKYGDDVYFSTEYNESNSSLKMFNLKNKQLVEIYKFKKLYNIIEVNGNYIVLQEHGCWACGPGQKPLEKIIFNIKTKKYFDIGEVSDIKIDEEKNKVIFKNYHEVKKRSCEGVELMCFENEYETYGDYISRDLP